MASRDPAGPAGGVFPHTPESVTVTSPLRDRYAASIRTALPPILDRIGKAAEVSGRSGDDVTLVAVTKGHPMAAVEAALDAGLRDLGENRVAELEEKVAATGRTLARWHMIGHLQRRKAPRILGICHLLHSVDSVRLAERLQRVSEEGGPRLPVLLQVNTSGEESKYGIPEEGALDRIGEVVQLRALDVRGLMTMAPFTGDEGVLRGTFRRLRELDEAARAGVTGYDGGELSMGMTNDYELAVQEGSTMVRLGTAIFGERPE